MAKLLWGKVYFHDKFAGILRQEPGNRYIFEYDENYIESSNPSIAYTLPKREKRIFSENNLHPFFDNLVSEGWLEQAQSRLLGKRSVSRFELLLTFGIDCIGAVSIIDPEPQNISQELVLTDPKEIKLVYNRASLSGIQPKMTLVKQDNKFVIANINDVSTHIAKFASPSHIDIIYNEYINTIATKYLIPEDKIVKVVIDKVDNIDELALIIERFDRNNMGKIHFEEFNQLLGLYSQEKYESAYKSLSDFILNSRMSTPSQSYILYKRIIVGILLGNTDMHMKNFAMFNNGNKLSLVPIYDQVCARLYDYKYIALTINNSKNLSLDNFKSKNLFALANEFNLSNDIVLMTIKDIGQNLEQALEYIYNCEYGTQGLKEKLIKGIKTRWKQIFDSIGN